MIDVLLSVACQTVSPLATELNDFLARSKMTPEIGFVFNKLPGKRKRNLLIKLNSFQTENL